ncbi:MAG: hypothetical protein GY765_00700 [bacterium]|nr:hypothetical protein [bacterium]
MSDTFEKLKSSYFEDYFSALKAIRNSKELQAALNSEHIKCICRSFELYRHGYEDVLEMKKRVLVALNRHIDNDKVKDKSLFRGIKRYAEGYLRRQYDSSGFIYVAGSIKIAAKIDLDKILEVLEADVPEDAVILMDYKKMLRRMESSSHNSYYILREVGNRFLGDLEPIIHSLAPASQDTILHALENFAGDKQVIVFYKKYMKKAAFEWLKDEAENYLNIVVNG